VDAMMLAAERVLRNGDAAEKWLRAED